MANAPQYLQLNKGGSFARMALLRMARNIHNEKRPPSMQLASWREARKYTFNNWAAAYCAGLNQGLNGAGAARVPVWYSHTGPNFRDERAAHDITRTIRHSGWFTDAECSAKLFGIVGRLTHGRYIAGYESSESGERVYFPGVLTDEHDAACMSDEHARIAAEAECEDAERYIAARAIESSIEDMTQRLTECIALRHKACMQYVRSEARTLCESIRQARETRQADYANYI